MVYEFHHHASAEQRSRCAIVTGAAGGIGLSVAKRLLGEGYFVSVCDRDSAVEDALLLSEYSDRVVVTVGDLTDDDLRRTLIRRTIDRFGAIDVLVNNAASGGKSNLLSDINLVDFRNTFEINVVAVVALTKMAIPYLKYSEHGRVINIGSLFADQPVAGDASYCASKGAIAAISRVLALELGSTGVTCNTVAPGLIMTDMHLKEVENQAAALNVSVEERLSHLRGEIPVERHGSSDDVASAVSYLAGVGSDYVSGQTLAVNGGVRMS